jgi:DNA-binding response OmpR family regulator
MRLLLVEDEIQLSESLCQILKKNKYSVDYAYDGEEGLDLALTGVYDIIVLDIMLPKLNGLDILKEMRKNNIETPTIMMTAKSQIQDKVTGLDLGADDYITKPFSIEELLARLRALARRKGELINDDILKFNDFSLNLSTYILEGKKNNVTLTLKEFEILRYFMYNPTKVISKDELILKIWGYDSEVEHNNIEVYVSFIRKKLNYIESSSTISTLRGIGYKLGGD